MTPTDAPPRPWTLRREFARLLVLVGLLPALLFGGVLLASQYRQERDRLADRLAINSRLNAAAFEDFLDGQLAGVALLADRAGPRAADWPAELAALRDHYPALLTVLVTDAAGNRLHADPAARVLAGANASVADRDYFRIPRDTGQPYVSDAFLGRDLGHDPLVAVAAPLLRDGRFDGIVEGSIRVDTFAALRAGALRQRHYALLLVDRYGHTIYAAPDLGLRFLQPVPAALRAGTVPTADAGEGGMVRVADLLADGGDALVGRSRLRNGWTLLLVAPEAELWTPILKAGVLMLVLVLAVGLGMVGASWWQGRLLGRGLERLLQSLRGFALGGVLDLHRVQAMPEELQPLAGAIGDLSHRLNRTYDELNAALLRQSELSASLRTVVDAREREIAQRTEELRGAVAQLDRLSRTDALTGCLNYRGSDDALRRLWEATRAGRAALSVLALDIDRFKDYNDRYGHQRGDNALKRFAGAVRSALFSPDDVLARQGGEEFLVFLPRATLEQALQVGGRIVASVAAAGIPHADSPEGVLTVSVGVAAIQPGEDADALLRRADAALYRAKRNGRNRVSD